MNDEIVTLETADRLYSQEAAIHLIKFSNERLLSLVKGISHLVTSLGDQKELSFWPGIIMAFRKIKFELTSLPLLPKTIVPNKLITNIAEKIPMCLNSFPDYAENLSQLVNILEDCQKMENKLTNWLREESLKYHDQKVSLCLLSSKYVKQVENWVFTDKSLSSWKLKIVSPQQLKKNNYFDRIYFSGSINLFTKNQFRDFDFVWRSPRANDLFFLSYDWIRDDFDPKPTFDTDINKVYVHVSRATVTQGKSEEGQRAQQGEGIDPAEIDFSPVEFFSLKPSTSSTGHYEAICESRLLALGDGTAILKEKERSSRIVEFYPQLIINKIPNQELETGMFLIVRTEGSGDSVAAVADMLFGEKKLDIRDKQEKWKIAFRRKLLTYSSVNKVADILTNMGAPTANETNVRNWQRNDTIKPHNEDDFKAIMAFSGLTDLQDECWENARKIDLMHKKAGKEISRILYNMIHDSKKVVLEKYGRLDVEIPGLTGKVSVVRIESILPGIYKVSSSDLNKIITFDGNSKWHE